MSVGDEEQMKAADEPASEEDSSRVKAEGTEASSAAATLQRRMGTVGTGREISLATLVHLMGLPTANQISLLETKIDLLTNRVGQVLAKLERMSHELENMKSDATIDRIDFQLTDIRALLKRTIPVSAAAGEVETKSDSPKPASARAKILSSTAPGPKPEEKVQAKPETKIVEEDQLAEFNEAPDDAAYQAAEGKRVRMQTKEGA